MKKQNNKNVKSSKVPLITIAIPNHNKQDHISNTIKSVLNQTDKDFEFIIIDNYSTDKSWDIIKYFNKKNPRIKIFRNSKNVGMSSNWNLCVQKASGEYLFILHADDMISPYFVSITKKLLSKYSPETIDYSYSINDEKSLKSNEVLNLSKTTVFNKEDVLSSYLTDKVNISIGTFIAKRQIFLNNKFTDKYKFVSDVEFLRRVYAHKKYNLVFYSEKLLCRKVYSYLSGLYMSSDEKYKLFRKEVDALAKELLEKSKKEKPYLYMKKEVMFSYYTSILTYIGATIYHGDFKEAKELLSKHKQNIIKYTGKKNVVRYYQALIFAKRKEIIPVKIKDFIFHNKNLITEFIKKR